MEGPYPDFIVSYDICVEFCIGDKLLNWLNMPSMDIHWDPISQLNKLKQI